MATYGHIPGVQITTSTGDVTSVVIGRDQYLTLVGVGAPDASADPNEVYDVRDQREVEDLFGEESDLARAYELARDNGLDREYAKVMRAEVTETSEEGDSGVLDDAPIVPDTSRITVEDATEGDEYDIVFTYGDELEAPEEENEIVINPNSGDYDANGSTVDITYESPDWESALDEVEFEFYEGEFGVISPLTNAQSVVDKLTDLIDRMRQDIKMMLGAVPAEPTGLNDDAVPVLDTGEVEQGYDDDTLFMFGPTAETDSAPNGPLYGIEAMPAVAGKMAGNDNTEPIYDDRIFGLEGIDQMLTRADVSDLRAEYIIPVRETADIRIEDNHSTYDQYENEGWERDYFRRRVVDLVIATSYMVARAHIGSVLDDGTVEDVDDALDEQLYEFRQDGLLQPGGQQIEVYRTDDRTIGADITITPYGVAKQAEIDIEVVA